MSLIRLFITTLTIFSSHFCEAQADSIFQTIQNLQKVPVKYLDAVENKIDKYSNRITGKTEKTLAKLSKWENKIKNILDQVSPETSQKLLGSNATIFTTVLKKLQEGKAITNKSLSIPVTLFFKSNGINVNQFPSRAGIGWAINDRGQISRVIRGQDNLLKQRYVPNFTVTPNDDDVLSTYCLHLTMDGNEDSEPALFPFQWGVIPESLLLIIQERLYSYRHQITTLRHCFVKRNLYTGLAKLDFNKDYSTA